MNTYSICSIIQMIIPLTKTALSPGQKYYNYNSLIVLQISPNSSGKLNSDLLIPHTQEPTSKSIVLLCERSIPIALHQEESV